jgi:cytochrome P450
MFYIAFTLIAAILIWYNWRKRHMSLLKRNGIPGPPPHLIYGNIKDWTRKGYVVCQKEWINKYGPIVGYYIGAKPFVLIADPELLKLVQIKDFHHFIKRPAVIEGGSNPNPRLRNSIVKVDGIRWKQMRSTLTPTFSGAKLKQMTPTIDSSISKMINNIEIYSQKNEEFDIHQMFEGLTMDVVTKTGFGIEIGVQDNLNNSFLNAARNIFGIPITQVLISLWFYFPELHFLLKPIRLLVEYIKDYFGQSDHGYILKISDKIINERRKNPFGGQKDFLQLMLEAKSSHVLSNDNLTVSSNMNNDFMNDTETNEISKISGMTNDEIAANAFIFFNAGFETTSSALAFVMHNLVNYEHIQQQLRDEVRNLLESDGVLDYNTVTKLKLMESVIYETMRLYPPSPAFISRAPNIDYNFGSMTIPKGTDCRVPLYYLHHDPAQWTDPEKFDPQRFSHQNSNLINPIAWQPFGAGPRNCIAMRFALLEIKLAISKLLINYKFVPSQKTQLGDISTDFKVTVMRPKYGVFMKAIKIS